MSSGYYQIEIAEEDRAKTAFLTKYGLFEHSRMPFGLCNAPATFQRAMSLVLRGLTWNEVLAYLDDILVGRSFEDHLQTLIKVFQRFRQHNLKLKAKICHLFQRKVVFLGRLVVKCKGAHAYYFNPDTAQDAWLPCHDESCLKHMMHYQLGKERLTQTEQNQMERDDRW